MKGSDLTAGPVYVLAGLSFLYFSLQSEKLKIFKGSSDSQVGTLDQTPVSLWRDGGFLRARQIMISSKLGKSFDITLVVASVLTQFHSQGRFGLLGCS